MNALPVLLCQKLAQRPVKAPERNNNPCKKTAPIAIFKKEYEDFVDQKWRKHLWLVKALGKHHAKRLCKAE